jgi:asparagine synthase (glutamine-hydrolysing)
MCGILGASYKEGVDLDVFERQLAKITHRGPDSSGIWRNENDTLALGSRRLAIRDLTESGRMPIVSASGKYVITFNGEIYNYKAIRNELIKRGYVFKSYSDTEVVLYSFEEWKEKAFSRLDGMFSIALYEKESRKLYLARDRSGEKPLYYRKIKGGFEFASELKSLMANPTLERKLNPQALSQYLDNGYCSGEVCFIKGVHKVEAANYLVYNTETENISLHAYWAPPEPSGTIKSKAELVEELDGLLAKSVKNSMIADVPVGVLLSGGVDSSLITAYAAQHSAEKIKTFHISFEGYGEFNESQYAKQIANHFDTDHVELSGDEITFNLIDELLNFFDEPLADSSMLPTYLVSKLTKEYVTVALGGDGGDELFGGYIHYLSALKRQNSTNPPSFIRSGLSSLGKILPVGLKGRNYAINLAGDKHDRFLSNRLYDKTSKSRIINSSYYNESLKAVKNIPSWEKSEDFIYSMTRHDFRNNLCDDVLVKVDRASMAHSLEMRAPWLSTEILDFAFGQVPSYLKTDGVNLKILPKLLLDQKLDFDFDLARKQGFSIPLNNWIKTKWRYDFEKEINDLPEDIIDRSYAKKLLKGVDFGFTNSSKLFALVILSKWLKKHEVTI